MERAGQEVRLGEQGQVQGQDVAIREALQLDVLHWKGRRTLCSPGVL